MGGEDTAVMLIDKVGLDRWRGSKAEIAERLARRIAEVLA